MQTDTQKGKLGLGRLGSLMEKLKHLEARCLLYTVNKGEVISHSGTRKGIYCIQLNKEGVGLPKPSKSNLCREVIGPQVSNGEKIMVNIFCTLYQYPHMEDAFANPLILTSDQGKRCCPLPTALRLWSP